jgi:hypothetical protein
MGTLPRLIPGLLIALAIAACSTDADAPALQNPPPTAPFNRFGQFQLTPVTLGPGVPINDGNQNAAAVVTDNLQPTLGVLLDSWSSGSGGVLQVAPAIEKIVFDEEPDWYWAGTTTGSATLVMRVTFTDEAAGTLVANPVFFQHGFGWGTAATAENSENATSSRIAEQITEYTRENYQQAVGGPAGFLPDRRRVGY